MRNISKNVHFNLCIDQDIITKVRYISKYNGRRTSTQIVMWLLEHIVDFELQNGEITEDDLIKEGIRK